MDTSFGGLLVGPALATFAYYALGALWFTPLFGRAWDSATGHRRTDGEAFGAAYYVVPLVACGAVSVGVALLHELIDVAGLGGALLLGLVVGAGIAVPVSVTNAMNPAMPRPYVYGAVTGGYHLVGAVVVSLLVTVA
ncbi:DUF1761 domain-containing protein [Mumia sp. Pv 4-285]|uniref:DUF1761 domain-containing protein n=1 Tax=Mumia qirimensis TaxID=3234852 RepID=UPI00351DA315